MLLVHSITIRHPHLSAALYSAAELWTQEQHIIHYGCLFHWYLSHNTTRHCHGLKYARITSFTLNTQRFFLHTALLPTSGLGAPRDNFQNRYIQFSRYFSDFYIMQTDKHKMSTTVHQVSTAMLNILCSMFMLYICYTVAMSQIHSTASWWYITNAK